MQHPSILHYWLDSLCLLQHTDTFLDHGYDTLEICKQVEGEGGLVPPCAPD